MIIKLKTKSLKMAATESDECSICCQPFTSTRRKPIKCKNPECGDICCLECFETALLTNDSTVPRCMFCDESIQLSYIREQCTLSFCNKKFLEKRVTNEVGSWESRLPDWQDHVILIKAKREHQRLREDYSKRAQEFYKMGHDVMSEFYSIPEPQLSHIKGNKDNKLAFVQKCPSGDCNGFLSAAWKCGICENFFCSKCRAQKNGKNDEDHVCNEDDVASVAAIKKSSRPCPKCGVPIHKTSGCDQMWCPQQGCNTAFSYKTGKIETGHIHNPHYYEFLRKQNGGNIARNPGDLPPCEQVPRIYEITRLLDSRVSKTHTVDTVRVRIREFLYRFYREKLHVEEVYLRPLRTDFEEDYKDMGVKYLMKENTKQDVKASIKKIIKKKEKNIELDQIYRLFVTVSGENLKNIYEILRLSRPDNNMVEEIEKIINLIKYCNESLNSLSQKFKNSVKYIEELKF